MKLARFICAAVLTDDREVADVDLAAPVDPNPSAEETADLLAGIRAGFDEAAEKYAEEQPSDAQKILIDGPVPSDEVQVITSNAERIGMLNEMNFADVVTGQPLDDEHINRFEKLLAQRVRHEEGADANTLMARYYELLRLTMDMIELGQLPQHDFDLG
ncbi:hypothetical protein SPFM15_00173 [Salmonella phage SPFM15]|nr:hypothetical protein SPFM5_00168 [Salmonella phage SPFM5]VFR13797.1 hypothetical protein SPFM15_00173 [Salmonella phage SPFM15]